MYTTMKGEFDTMPRMDKVYGECECGAGFIPVWFIDEEYRYENSGIMYKTGRKRRACSHLECPNCFKRQCVDDSFDSDFK